MKKSHLPTLLKVAVAIALLAWLIRSYGEEMRPIVQRPKDLRWLALGVAVTAAAILLTFVRWHLLLLAQEVPCRLSDTLRLGFIGYLFNFVMPSSVGGDLVKAVLLAQGHAQRRTMAISTVVMDRLAGLIALFYVGSVASLVAGRAYERDTALQVLVRTMWGLTAAVTAVMALLLVPAVYRSGFMRKLAGLKGIGTPVGQIVVAMSLYAQRRRMLLLAVGMSVVSHLGFIGAFHLIGRSLRGGEGEWYPTLLAHHIVVPLAFFASALAPTLGGLGVTEGTLAWLYSGLATSDEHNRAIAQAQGAMQALVMCSGGAVVPGWLTLAQGALAGFLGRAALAEMGRLAIAAGAVHALAFRISQIVISAAGASVYWLGPRRRTPAGTPSSSGYGGSGDGQVRGKEL